MFICGNGSFGNEDEQVEKESQTHVSSPCPTPKRSRRSTSFCKIIGKDNSNKNPFADRGLDKFYALLADLDDKKQKIYTQKGSEEISFVRFVYANDSDKAKPIVVKVKEKKQENNVNVKNMIKHPSNKSVQADSGNTSNTLAADKETNEKMKKKRRSLRCNGSFKLENFLRPYYYFPVMVVLILMFLAIYGRSFAILCTSIGWYLAPTIVGGSSSSSSSPSERKPKRKKEYVRKQSEVKEKARSEGPSSPKSVINGLTDNLRVQQQQQQQQHGRKKSW